MHSLYKQGNLPYLTVKLCQNCEKLIPINSECCPHCSYNFTSRTMDKPLSMRRMEFAENMAKVINESGLPPCIMLDVLQIVTAQVGDLATQQLQTDREAYRDALLKESEEE